MSVPAPLYALILAGGQSTRMGADKGALEYHGRPQAAMLHELLARHCGQVFASINPAQAQAKPYTALPVIVDALPRGGPATGLLSAAQAYPAAAWLVVAVDLVALDDRTLSALVAGRRVSAAATAFRHADGTIEPLCAIWEPAAQALLADRVACGDASPRRCLEAADVELLVCPEPRALRSVNSPQERARLTTLERPR